MRQRLSIALVQVKAGNTYENLLNEIRQTIYSLYPKKQFLKKVYNNIISSIKSQNRMDTISMRSKNSKTSYTHKVNLKRSDKDVALSNVSVYYTWKIIRRSYKNNKFKISASTWNCEFELPGGSYYVSDIQIYFEYI